MTSNKLLEPGTRLAQRYEVARLLGQGGMGAVYLVRDLRLQSVHLAVKELWPESDDPAEQQQARALFEREANLLAGLAHHHLPRVTDFFSEAGRDYLVMEFVDGRTLEDRVEKEGPVPVEMMVSWALQICDLLDYLHTRPTPVILRDVKPSNVMITPADEVKVIDFGIARLFSAGKAGDTIALGTPGYAPPEQYGRAQSDARADVFGLGATMHFALTGRDPALKPFAFDAPSKTNPAVPAALDAVILTAVKTNPDERYPSARDMAEALQDAIGAQAGPGGATSAPPSAFYVPATTLSALMSRRSSGTLPEAPPPRPASSETRPLAAPDSPPVAPATSAPASPPVATAMCAPAAPRPAPAPMSAPAPPAPAPPRAAPAPAPPVAPAPTFEPARLSFGTVQSGPSYRLRFRVQGEVDGLLVSNDRRWLRVEPHRVRGRDPYGEAIVYTGKLRDGREHEGSISLRTRQGTCSLPISVRLEAGRLGAWTAILAVLLTCASLVPAFGLVATLSIFLLYLGCPRPERGSLRGFVTASFFIGLINLGVSYGLYRLALHWWQ